MKFIPNDSQLGLTEKSKRLNIFFLILFNETHDLEFRELPWDPKFLSFDQI